MPGVSRLYAHLRKKGGRMIKRLEGLSEDAKEDYLKSRQSHATVTLQSLESWHVVQPHVYRYEDKQWIEEFFANGTIRLSSFAKFATYKDENRGDDKEGKAIVFTKHPDKKMLASIAIVGHNSAVLSTSQRLDRNLAKSFSRSSAFEITNTVGFAREIARSLSGYKFGFEGNCVYRPDTTVNRIVNFSVEQFMLPEGQLSMDLLQRVLSEVGPEVMLVKRQKYQHQQEFRFIWELDNLGGDFVDVEAPLATQYCRRVTDEEWL